MLKFCSMNRLKVLQRILSTPPSNKVLSATLIPKRNCSASDPTTITIGNVSKQIKEPKTGAYVPYGYLKQNLPQSHLQHLKWMLQKDKLGQDIFLIGPPGPLRRNLALSYLELIKKEVELITLTRDTTDSDLKQRKEILKGTSFYHDQSAVRAAIEGRVLLLEGVEKAERNVLPVLNNLLENREMQLEDGRLLIPATRYDKLLKDHTEAELEKMKLVRVSEDFRVIALGIPSPPYQGHPLDPPLRSRFQARDITSVPFKDAVEELKALNPSVPDDVVSRTLSLAHTLSSKESKSLSLPDFPIDNLPRVIAILDKYPSTNVSEALMRIYPASSFMSKDALSSVKDAFKTFDLEIKGSAVSKTKDEIIEVIPSKIDGIEGDVRVKVGGQAISTKVFTGNTFSGAPPSFILTDYHRGFLTEMLQSHTVGDFCLIGNKGCGKSAAVQQLAHMLGYQTEPILLYQDMTSRDLVQQRVTTAEGDTSWQFSPLVSAALEGRMAILDGIHRLHHGTLAVLHRLLSDREMQLYDGTRLVRHDRYDSLKQQHQLTDQEMKTLGVLRVHPSFRVVGLAEPPNIGGTKGQWLNAESLTLFMYHQMRPLSMNETTELVENLVGKCAPAVEDMIRLSAKLSVSNDAALRSLSQSLSLRQVIRTAKRFQAYPEFDLHTAVYKACLARFLPPLAKQALDKSLEDAGIQAKTVSQAIKTEVEDGILRIGNTHAPIHKQSAASSKVPDTLFFDIKQHVGVLENMLQDWLLGDHLLLIGNQGVGKNKLADRFLYLLNRPREYIQLHRDTTVQSLTIQPVVKDGRISYEDSPLVSAVKTGHVLVVDEADKAPTYVTCVLKTLVESGEMLLSDGRRIVPSTHALANSDLPNVIVSHPDFRMMVLANRPGFPFLGNDFFGSLGDLFSCHAIDNPSMESEMDLLRHYGPDVPEEMMSKLVSAFGELRDFADQGLIQYPYSTREVVQIVKHMQAFPDDAIAVVVKNVFDFDSWSPEAKKMVVGSMHRHGIPVDVDASSVSVAKRIPLPEPIVACKWEIRRKSEDNLSVLNVPVDTSALSYKGPLDLAVNEAPLDAIESRAAVFSEQHSLWQLPLYETSLVTGITTSLPTEESPQPKELYIAAVAPAALYALDLTDSLSKVRTIMLNKLIHTRRGFSTPRTTVAAMKNNFIAVHEEVTNTLVVTNFETGQTYSITLASMIANASKIVRQSIQQQPDTFFRMSKSLSEQSLLPIWEHGGHTIQLVDMSQSEIHSTTVPFTLAGLHPLNKNDWMLTATDGAKWLMRTENESDIFPSVLHRIDEEQTVVEILKSSEPLSDHVLSSALDQQISAPSRLFAPCSDLAAIAVGFPELDSSQNEIYLWAREGRYNSKIPNTIDPAATVALLPEVGQVVRVIENLPTNVSRNVRKTANTSYLEITDLINHNLAYVPCLRTASNPTWNFFARGHAAALLICPNGPAGIASVDAAGGIRIWDTGSTKLQEAYGHWRKMIGQDDNPLRLDIQKGYSDKKAQGPKHGKQDPTGNPHVGGNTWAGGTGGRDTAGLGGAGGPHRLDAGHDVHQVTQAEKDAVPEEIRKAAREMAKKAFEERLREIQMSSYDANLYEKLLTPVRPQIKTLRNTISSLQAKNKERQWLRHKTDGELDDMKLIEGLAGEKNIYRQRREEEPEIGAPQTKPKRLRLIVDVSGSMYRFNGHDGRLERELEATLMVMEAFESFDNKFKFEIFAHSGDSADEVLVRLDDPPKNNRERLDVLKTMQAHSQFCISGDNTLEAAKSAISSLSDADSDESFVILLSDANLDRYGIRPSELAKVLTSNDSVQAYAIFIGSLGNQAEVLAKSLPAGRGFECMDLSKLPQIMQQIFTSAMIT